MPKSPRCSRQRCSKPIRAEGMCASHAQAEADRLYSLYVRAWFGKCLGTLTGAPWSRGFWAGPRFDCAGGLQCAHLVSRGYHATRWSIEPMNAVALCAGHHRWFDTHPVEREDMCAAWMGDDWDVLKKQARALAKPDLSEVIRSLKEAQ